MTSKLGKFIKRHDKDLATLDEAKRILNIICGLDEPAAHTWLVQTAMHHRVSLIQTAEIIILFSAEAIKRANHGH